MSLRSALFCLLAAGIAAVEPQTERFAAADAVLRFRITGDVAIDAGRSATADGTGALRLGPKARAILPLRDEDGSGSVTFSVFDDGLAPPDTRLRSAGPLSGVLQRDGLALVAGAIYAPYLTGEKHVALSNHQPGKDGVHAFIRYLGIQRKPGWRTWRYDFDAVKGLVISCDGRAIEAKRFDWNDAKQTGFNALVFTGDASAAGGMAWIDDISVTLGGPMRSAPTTTVPPPQIVPVADPPVAAGAPELLPAWREVHPRLLFGPEDVPRMRAFYASEDAKPFREAMLRYLPSCTVPARTDFLTDATDGQRQGYWRLPTVALHYVLTGERQSFERALAFLTLLNGLPDWETAERNAGMSAANIMIGAGLALDWLWHDLDPDFREEFRRKCLWHARAMYHGGHLKKATKVHYWQNDPGNNHRWHRNAGLAACLFAAYTGAAEEQWIMQRFVEEMDFVVRWLPPDGTSHESPTYMIFGLSHLVLGAQILDRTLGTQHLRHRFFATVPTFVAQSLTPDRKARFNYGDMGGIGVGKVGYDACMYLCAAIHGLRDEQAVIDWQAATHGLEWGWMGLLWRDPALGGGDPGRLATSAFFEDVGVLFARDGWKDDGVGVMFKCGPFGGYTLNRYRNAGGATPNYINVAHDDPDANTFLIYARNRYLVESDRYSEDKRSANHNTILVNGLGQMAEGRAEGGVWSQPGGDMTRMGVITALKLTSGIDVVEGEAAGSYLAHRGRNGAASRPALERFRRALVFAKGGYVLVLDDIRAPERVEISWLVQAPQLAQAAGAQRSFVLANGDADCPFSIATDRDATLRFAIVDATADTKKKAGQQEPNRLGWKQLRMIADAEGLRSAAVFDVYRKGLSVSLDASDPAQIAIAVRGDGIDDRWTWHPAVEPTGTYRLIGMRGGAPMIETGAADRPVDPLREH